MENKGTRIVKTTCGMCAINCGIDVYVENGKVVNIAPNDEHIVHDLCIKAGGIIDMLYSNERITYPIRKVNGTWKRITWDRALDIIVNKLEALRKEFGPESLSLFLGQGISLGDSLIWAKRFSDLFGTPNSCSGNSHCYYARVVGGNLVTGQGYTYSAYNGTKCIVLWGTNPENSSKPAATAIDFALSYGAKFIAVDPRVTPLAKRADIHAQLRPGTDSALALGLMHVIIGEKLYDKKFVDEWTVGFEKLSKYVEEFTPERVEKITWVPADIIREIAQTYALNKPASVLLGISLDHCTNGIQAIRAVVSLITMTGNYDIPGGNSYVEKLPKISMRLPDMIKAEPFDKEHPVYQEYLEEPPVTHLIRAILTEKPYPIKALINQGGGIITQFPNRTKTIEAFKKMDLVVSMDLFMTETAKLSDIVLPACSFLERTELWTMYMGLPLATLKIPAIEPLGESWPDWKLWFELAKRMGYGEYFPWEDVEEAIAEFLEPSGITVQGMKDDSQGMFWGPRDLVKRYHFRNEGFPTPSGKVEYYSEKLEKLGYDPLPTYHEPAESPISRPELAKEYPFIFTTGARIKSFTHSQHRNIPVLRKQHPEPLMDINATDAKKLGINEGDMAMVESLRGNAKFKSHVIDGILPGVIHVEHGWGGEANANFLTDDETLDPISGYPAFRQGLCRVRKL